MTHITVVNGPSSGTQIALTRGETCTIGSGPSCTVRIDLPGVAAVQAEIKALKQDGFGIKRSGGPVSVNGASVEAARLSEGDVIDVASVQLVFGAPQAPRQSDDARSERPAKRPAPAGRLLGGFRLMEVLGKGGMGTVYRAEQVSLHREVALKVLDEALTQDPVFVARFVAEARAAARLHHPNVVQVYDVGHEGSTYYYSMELMTEGSVETKLKSKGRLDVATATRAIADAARGLAYAESLRIVHRDIKPDNLMLDHHGSVKLADLGLAMTDENEESKVVGTPHFMSPEQILRKPLDHRSDLYSLGCTYYRLLTGKNPFSSASVKDILRAQVKEDPEPAHKVVSDVPAEVSSIVQRLMEKEPADRFQSANELGSALEEVLAPPVRKGLLIGGIVVALAVAGGAVAWAMTRKNETKIIETRVVGPEAEANARRAREAEAEAAYLRATRDAYGTALADALEAMAKEHDGTEHASKARDEAVRVRADVAAAQAAAAQRAGEVERWKGVVSGRVREALARSDLRAAASALALDDVPEALRADPALAQASADLTNEVQRRAAEALEVLVAAVETARGGKDPAAVERAAAGLAAAVEGEGAWPKVLLPAPDAALATLSVARTDVQRLRAEQQHTQVEAAWTRMQAAFTDGGGVLAQVQAMQWQAAAQAAHKIAEELTGMPAGEQADPLAQSLAHAVEHLGRVKDAAAAGALTLVVAGESEPCAVTAFQPEGEHAGFTVKVGPKHQPRTQSVRLAALPADSFERALCMSGEHRDDVACVLGWMELARHLDGARAYLRALDPKADGSGTGQGAYPFNDREAARLAEHLATRNESWAQALHAELAAAALLANGLQAFSGQRNLAAAEQVELLLRAHPRSLLVAALR